jgi:hypothetical protein
VTVNPRVLISPVPQGPRFRAKADFVSRRTPPRAGIPAGSHGS